MCRPRIALIATTSLLTMLAAGAPPVSPIEAARKLAEQGPGEWGVLVVDEATGEEVLSIRPDALLQPASCQKVFATAAILDALGPDWTTPTIVYSTVAPDSAGVVAGDLVLYGGGDPNLSDRFSPGNSLGPLRELARRVRASGVRQVEGGLVADESYLSGPPHGSGWGLVDLQWYFGAEVSALSFNDNLAEVRVVPGERNGDPCTVELLPDVGYLQVINETKTGDPAGRVLVHGDLDGPRVIIGGGLPRKSAGWRAYVAVHDPALYTAAAFRVALEEEGIAVAAPTRHLDANMVRPEALAFDHLTELARLDSAPLRELVRVVNKRSQNLHAELMLRLLGRVAGDPGKSSDEAGVELVRAYLRRAGVEDGVLSLRDGSGLSRLDRITARALAATVLAARGSPGFVDSLPRAGVDGTLRGRLAGLDLAAKTGSLATAKSLAGYLRTASGRRLIVVFVCNGRAPTGYAVGRIDQMLTNLAKL